ncbi:BcsR/BcsP family cellulose biosynthesis protein [Hylemonella sp. W303a]|uniref:BcsR/BcsP family cellulose biosynthesis protein n=1 Tax=Hylemonella sp. W303a TaxID=3389873 RepID=UPI00396AF866
MAVPTRNSEPRAASGLPGGDVTALFAHVGAASRSMDYQELVRDEAAQAAASRWPLLAEIVGQSIRTRAP